MMPATEQFADLRFPLNGIDMYMAYSMQRVGTTPSGRNVRAFEPTTERARGGSRPGLTKWIPPQLPSGAHLVQHLYVIVDPTPDALGDADLLDDTAVEDPSDNPSGSDPNDPTDKRVRNRRPHVRRGGHGWTRNRYTKRKSSRRFLQQASVSLVAPFGTEPNPSYSYSLAYPNPLTASSLLVMALFRNGVIDDADAAPTIIDSAGNAFTLAGHATASLFNNKQIWLWYAVNVFGAVANTGSFTVFPGAFTTNENDLFAVLEYSGFRTSGPLDQVLTGTTTAPWTLGNVGVAANDMVLGAFGGFYDTSDGTHPGSNTMTPSSPYKARSTPSSLVQNFSVIPQGDFWQGLIVCDHIDAQAAEGPSVALDANQDNGIGLVCSFKAQ